MPLAVSGERLQLLPALQRESSGRSPGRSPGESSALLPARSSALAVSPGRSPGYRRLPALQRESPGQGQLQGQLPDLTTNASLSTDDSYAKILEQRAALTNVVNIVPYTSQFAAREIYYRENGIYSAPNILSGVIRNPYELIVEECLKTFIISYIHEYKSHESNISLDKFNELFTKFYLYVLYSAFKDSESNHIFNFFNIILNIEKNLDDLLKIINNVISSSKVIPSDKNKVISNLQINKTFTMSITIEKPDLAVLYILKYLLIEFTKFFELIFDKSDSEKVYATISSGHEFNKLLEKLNTGDERTKLAHYFYFNNEEIKKIFDNVNITSILSYLSSIPFIQIYKDYLIEENTSEDSSIKIEGLLKDYMNIIYNIKKVFCFIEILYNYFNETFILLDIESITNEDYKKGIENKIQQLLRYRTEQISHIVNASRIVATREACKTGVTYAKALNKSAEQIYEREIASSFKLLDKATQGIIDTPIVKERELLGESIEAVRLHPKFREAPHIRDRLPEVQKKKHGQQEVIQ